MVPSRKPRQSRDLSSTSWPGEEIHWRSHHEHDAGRNDTSAALLFCHLLPIEPTRRTVHVILRTFVRYQRLLRLLSAHVH